MSIESPQFTKRASSRAKDVVRDSKSPALLGLGQTESGLSLEQGESVISSKEVPSISVNRLTMGVEGSLSTSSRSFAASIEGLRSEIIAMNALSLDERGSTRGRVSNQDSDVVISESQAIEDLRARLNTMKANMLGVSMEDLVPIELAQEEISTPALQHLTCFRLSGRTLLKCKGKRRLLLINSRTYLIA
ncbi:hypothetical protein CsSME_00012227 [Camellia sinensis var. sinensis]